MKIEGKKFKLVVQEDGCPESPREWDNSGRMICFHRRYNLGDKHEYTDSRDFLEEMAERFVTAIEFIAYGEYMKKPILNTERVDLDRFSNSELFQIIQNNLPILPLYLYDHSGISISSRPFSCRFDSGFVGFIYMPEGEMIQCFKEDFNFAEEMLEKEVKVYDQFLQGEVYNFTLYKKEGIYYRKIYTDAEGNYTGEEESIEELKWVEYDSCSGFYGADIQTNGIMRYLTDEAINDLGLKKGSV